MSNRDLTVRLRGDTTGYQKAMGTAEQKTGKFRRALKNAETGSTALLGGLVAVGAGAAVFGFKSVQAYNASVEASKKLETNMMNVKGATETQVQSLEKLASKLQSVGVIEDDVIKAGMSQLATFNLQAKTIEGLTPKITDMVAQLKGHNATAEDMVAINNLVGKVMTGNVGSLSRYGVTLDENQKKMLQNGTETEKMNTLNKVLAQNYGKVNEALRNTPQGQLTALKNTFGDFMELVGEGISEAILPLIKGFNDWMESMGGPEGMLKRLKDIFAQLQPYLPVIIGAIIGGLIPAFAGLAVAIWSAMAPLIPFIAIGAALGLAVKLLVDHFGGMDNIMKKLQPTFTLLASVFNTYVKPAIDSLWQTIQKDFLPALKKLWEQISPVLLPALKALGAIIGTAMLAHFLAFVKGAQLAIKVITAIINWMIKFGTAVKNFWQFWGNLARRIGMALAGVPAAIKKPFENAWNWIKGLPGRIVNSVGNVGKLLKQKMGNYDIPGPLGKVKDVIPGFASGITNFGGGLAYVHKGEVLANLPPGTDVYTAAQSRRILENQQTGNSSNVNNNQSVTFAPTINVDMGMYAGMPTEKRQIAIDIWTEIIREARKHNVILPNIGVVTQ